MNYKEYRELVEANFALGKTTGIDTKEYLEFTKMNIQRMKRLDKTIELTDELKQALLNVKHNFDWIVLSEGWCGDAAQNVPVLNAIANNCPKIKLDIILRDENVELMDKYLTNGGRSIPKLICRKENTDKDIFTWGPRPAQLQKIVEELKKNNPTHEEKGLVVQNWYNHDKTLSVQEELTKLITDHMS